MINLANRAHDERSIFGKPAFGVASDVTDESSYESDEHSCSEKDSVSYLEDHVTHVENESSAHQSNYQSTEHRDSDGDAASYFGDWVSQFESVLDKSGDDHN